MIDYSEIPGVNFSTLKLLDKHTGGSPLLYQYLRENPPGPRFALGRAFHTATLEPHLFEEQYVVTPELSESIKDIWWDVYKSPDSWLTYPGKVRRGKVWDKFKEDHKEDPRPTILQDQHDRCMRHGDKVRGKDALSQDHWDQAIDMAARVRDSRWWPMLDGCSVERIVTWTDPKTGLPCKLRADALRQDMLLDLKSARRVDPDKFDREAGGFLYHAQLSFYRWGCVQAGLLDKDAPVVIWPVQSQAPWEVAAPVDLDERVLDAGESVWRECLDTLAGCLKSNKWPGSSPERREMHLSTWAPGVEEGEQDTDWTNELEWRKP